MSFEIMGFEDEKSRKVLDYLEVNELEKAIDLIFEESVGKHGVKGVDYFSQEHRKLREGVKSNSIRIWCAKCGEKYLDLKLPLIEYRETSYHEIQKNKIGANLKYSRSRDLVRRFEARLIGYRDKDDKKSWVVHRECGVGFLVCPGCERDLKIEHLKKLAKLRKDDIKKFQLEIKELEGNTDAR